MGLFGDIVNAGGELAGKALGAAESIAKPVVDLSKETLRLADDVVQIGEDVVGEIVSTPAVILAELVGLGYDVARPLNNLTGRPLDHVCDFILSENGRTAVSVATSLGVVELSEGLSSGNINDITVEAALGDRKVLRYLISGATGIVLDKISNEVLDQVSNELSLRRTSQ